MPIIRLIALLALAVLAGIGHGAHGQPAEQAVIDARKGAKVNVRSSAEVVSGNVSGTAYGGDRATVIATTERPPYTWYRLQSENGTFEGWVRGDLVRLIPPGPGGAVSATATPTTQPSATPQTAEPAAVPTAATSSRGPLQSRSDWSNSLIELLPAVRSCVSVSSAPPSVALRAFQMQRGLAEVVIRDAADRQWNCIARQTGGTPIRYDPIFSSRILEEASVEPIFVPVGQDRPQGDECRDIEVVTDSTSGDDIGWLIYQACS